MKLLIAFPVVSLIALISVAAGATADRERALDRRPGGHAIAYIHDLVEEQARQGGEARVIVVLGHPSLPKAWARDWRERGPAINELMRQAKAAAPHFRVCRQYGVFPFVAGMADRRALDELAASSVVEAIYPDREHHAVLAESGPLIGQPQAETGGFTGAGIGIAVIDTGVDYTHYDLGQSPPGDFPNAKVIGGYDFVNSDSHPMDDNGHGTYVAAIAAGMGPTYRGIAPGALVIALKVLDSTGLGYSSAIIAALEWCITNKTTYNIRVANLSLSDGSEWRDPAVCDADPEGVAINEAVAAGIVVCAAAGNEGFTHGVGIPACASSAIAVGATGDGGPAPAGESPVSADAIASFSNRGELIDVYAPGIWITSARLGGGYETAAGTSASSPHVAGAAALAIQMLGAGATPSAVIARLARTGVQIVDSTTDVATPRVDLVRAMGNLPSVGADLIVTAVTSSSSSGLPGDSITVGVTVKNQGDQASSTCKAVVALSENSIASPQDPALAVVDVPAISPSQSWSSGSITGAIPHVAPSTYSLVAFADSEYQVAEKNETQNGLVGADFTVESLSSYIQSSTIPASMAKGETASVSITIWNDGTVAWTSADGYALSAVSPLGNSTWGMSQVALPTATVPAAGTVTFSFTITAPTTAGLYPCHWQMAKGGVPFGEVATGAVKTRVIDDAQWGQAYSAVGGDWAAFEHYFGITSGDYRIAVTAYDLTSGYNVTMPDDIPFPTQWDPVNKWYEPIPPYENFDISYQIFPDISGSWATWMVDDYPESVWNYQITAQNALDLNTLPLRITYQDKDAMFPAIDGHLVVWEDYRNDPDGMMGLDFLNDNSDIFICDISDVTGPTDHFPPAYPICTAPGPQLLPRISGNLVVWEDWRDLAGVQSDIYAYDLSVDSDGDGIPNWKETTKPSPDPAEMQLTATPWSEEFPDISQSTAVWMDFRRDLSGLGSVVDLYAATVGSPTAVAIAADPPTFRYRPRISYPLVVWEDYTNDADGPSTGGLADRLADNPDIRMHHLGTGQMVAIAASGGIEEWPDVSGNRVTYAKHRATVVHTGLFGIPYDWPVFNVWAQRLPPEGMTGIASFSDVPATFWAWKQIEAAVAHGVVQGYPEGTYLPIVSVTRDQMAVFIARALAGGDGSVPAGPATASFADVPTSFWAYKYIEYCVDPDQGVVQGFEDGSYQPNQAVNRGQMAAFIARAQAGGDGNVPAGPVAASFPDVPTDFWAYRYVEYIADAGVTQGYPDGNYHPETIVTRDQMAVYISRAFGYTD